MPWFYFCMPYLALMVKENGYHHTTTILRPFFPGPPGWAGARIEFLDFMVQGKTNRGRHTDHLAGRHSIGLTSAHLHHPHFFTVRMPFLSPNQQCQSTEDREWVQECSKFEFCQGNCIYRSRQTLVWRNTAWVYTPQSHVKCGLIGYGLGIGAPYLKIWSNLHFLASQGWHFILIRVQFGLEEPT